MLDQADARRVTEDTSGGGDINFHLSQQKKGIMNISAGIGIIIRPSISQSSPLQPFCKSLQLSAALQCSWHTSDYICAFLKILSSYLKVTLLGNNVLK